MYQNGQLAVGCVQPHSHCGWSSILIDGTWFCDERATPASILFIAMVLKSAKAGGAPGRLPPETT